MKKPVIPSVRALRALRHGAPADITASAVAPARPPAPGPEEARARTLLGQHVALSRLRSGQRGLRPLAKMELEMLIGEPVASPTHAFSLLAWLRARSGS